MIDVQNKDLHVLLKLKKLTYKYFKLAGQWDIHLQRRLTYAIFQTFLKKKYILLN